MRCGGLAILQATVAELKEEDEFSISKDEQLSRMASFASGSGFSSSNSIPRPRSSDSNEDGDGDQLGAMLPSEVRRARGRRPVHLERARKAFDARMVGARIASLESCCAHQCASLR
jgi:hypothetical protein